MISPPLEVKEFFAERRSIQAFYDQYRGLTVYRSINLRSNEDELLFLISPCKNVRSLLKKRSKCVSPHLARLTEIGLIRATSNPYWVCPLDLASKYEELLSEQSHNPHRIAELVLHVAYGLSALHKNDLYHGDVRAGNVWVRLREGREEAFLLGVAIDQWVFIPSADAPTVEQARYMAPERTIGESSTILSDIYSFAILMYRSLCGSYPFDGSDPWSITAAHATEDVPSPSPALSQPLWELLLKALSKDPKDRPKSLNPFIQILQEYVQQKRPLFMKSPTEPLDGYEKERRKRSENTMLDLPVEEIISEEVNLTGEIDDTLPNFTAESRSMEEEHFEEPSEEPYEESFEHMETEYNEPSLEDVFDGTRLQDLPIQDEVPNLKMPLEREEELEAKKEEPESENRANTMEAVPLIEEPLEAISPTVEPVITEELAPQSDSETAYAEQQDSEEMYSSLEEDSNDISQWIDDSEDVTFSPARVSLTDLKESLPSEVLAVPDLPKVAAADHTETDPDITAKMNVTEKSVQRVLLNDIAPVEKIEETENEDESFAEDALPIDRHSIEVWKFVLVFISCFSLMIFFLWLFGKV